MKALLSWMREFAPDIDGDPHHLGDVMSDIGLCCEEVRLLGGNLEGIVVARVLELNPHPDADRIQLVSVDAGDGDALQICCGAFNMSVGDLVPLATIGTTMPGGMEIARRKLRGQWSNGMLCSGQELELTDDHDGILILPPDLIPGVAFAEAMGIEADVLFDLDLTPNRPDAMSILGVARDVAARLGVPFAVPSISVPTEGEPIDGVVGVEILDPVLCGRFTVRALTDVPTGPSPDLVAQRLTLMGMRPISAMVDLSNYVMLEYGQPNHAYDLARVAGRSFRVRRATAGEEIETLDGQRRVLHAADGVIADGDDTPIGVAGVMGGANTEISDNSTDVLLELAWWDPTSIAVTSRRLGLRSEASVRFEKGVDPEIAEAAADRFCQLAVELGAKVRPGTVVAHGQVPPRPVTRVRTARVARVLGADIPQEEIVSLLDPIGFTSVPVGHDLDVDLPTWRPDSTGEIDVIEEIARMRGYTTFQPRLPEVEQVGHLTDAQRLARRLVDVLVARGAVEVQPMPFLAPGTLERYGLRDDAVVVTNPLDARESVLRTSLIPGIMATLGANASHRNRPAPLFEAGTCYAQAPEGADLPIEWRELGVALPDAEAPAAVQLAHVLLAAVGAPPPAVVDEALPGLHPGRSAKLVIDDRQVGVVGEIAPGPGDADGVTARVAWLSLDLDVLLEGRGAPSQAIEVSRFPSSDLDLALVVDDQTGAHEISAALASAHPLVVDVRLFDVYRGESLGEGRRSLAFAVRLQASDHTLVDEETAGVRTTLIAAAEALGATLR